MWETPSGVDFVLTLENLQKEGFDDMKVQVNLFANLVKYAPEGRKAFSVELKPAASAGDLIKHLGIPPAQSKIILVNGRHSNEDTALNDGDEVTFMTPVEGG